MQLVLLTVMLVLHIASLVEMEPRSAAVFMTSMTTVFQSVAPTRNQTKTTLVSAVDSLSRTETAVVRIMVEVVCVLICCEF